jgi:hypothetical protein
MTTIGATPNNELRQRRRHHGSGGGVVVLGGGRFDGGGISILQQKRVDDDNINDNDNGDGGGGGAFAVVSSMFALQKEPSHHQKKQVSATSATAATASMRSGSSRRLADATAVDRIFPKAAALAVVVWILLLLFVYTYIPSSGRYPLAYLNRQEQEAATLAFCIMCVATVLLIMPFVFGRASMAPGRDNGRRSNLSGVVIAALAVQLVSCATNGILAFLPNVVIVDPVTHAPVYLTRWCEWIVLSGFMTFLSEMVDLEKPKPQVPRRTQQYYLDHPLFEPIVSGLVQSLSCVCGFVFPFCYGVADWSFVMFISMVTYLLIFPRTLLRKRNFEALRARRSSQQSSRGVGGSFSGGGGNGYSAAEMEEYERRRFAYYLMSACSIGKFIVCSPLLLLTHRYLYKCLALATRLTTINRFTLHAHDQTTTTASVERFGGRLFSQHDGVSLLASRSPHTTRSIAGHDL